MATLTVNKSQSPAVQILCEFLRDKHQIDFKEDNETKLVVDNITFVSTNSILRYLARTADKKVNLYGKSILDAAEIDTFLDYSVMLTEDDNVNTLLEKISTKLETGKFMVGNCITIADFAIFPVLNNSINNFPNIKKYVDSFSNKLSSSSNESAKAKKKEEGKFIDLPGAKMGEVVVRFPPEASGYLHIGHAKAALLNQFYQTSFNGKLIMRFDDTNPAKESSEFEMAILDDLKMLGVKPDIFTHTSDKFDLMIEYCEKLIKSGDAYVDDTEPEIMKKQRDDRFESKNRNNSVDKNLNMWNEMINGTILGKKCCVRVKMDMKSNNGCLRDPTIYRCKDEVHVRTGEKYKVYPTYDFACPIIDSVEGVTHTLRTTEYRDRDDQYYWFIDKLKLRKPYIWEYSRLNLQNIVMSKRKLTWFVDEGIVEGWDDPRFPTVRGVMRRGMTVEGLKQFVIAQGSTKSVNFMEWDKIWAFNKKVIDPIVPRYTALLTEDLIKVNIIDAQYGLAQVPKHPKNDSIGMKTIFYSPVVLVEKADASLFVEGENVTFVNWGNIKINKINKDSNNHISSITAKLNLDDKNFKKTLKVTWLPETEKEELVEILCKHYDHLITKGILEKDDDFKKFVNYDSCKTFTMLGDSEISKLKKGEIIQLQRKGYYIVDKPYEPHSRYSGRKQSPILILIPDGSQEKTEGQIGSKKVKEISKKVDLKQPSTQFSNIIGASDATSLHKEITIQGEKIRKLKANKTEKAIVQEAVTILLSLKSKFKSLTGKEWTPTELVIETNAVNTTDIETLNEKIIKQGDKIRELKSNKVGKEKIDIEVKSLLSLKSEFKSLTGNDWKLDNKQSMTRISSTNVENLNEAITKQGDIVRKLKLAKGDKNDIDAAVKILLSLKSEYKTAFGCDWKPESSKANIKPSVDKQQSCAVMDQKKSSRLGLEVKKEDDLSEWYSQVITKSELIEYYDVSGCYILRAWSFAIWEVIQSWFDTEIKKLGVDNCYFPLFVSNSALQKEKDHIADFSPEVAWVTKCGNTDLAEPVAIRPTSETVMYPAYAKWVQSHRDLPIKLNQWCCVVRWEFKHPQPFIRTREFLWQEGHTAYSNESDAIKEVYEILELYAQVYENLMAIPVVRGRKTEKEKFAGGTFTTTIEAYIPASGRGIQGATSHHLGQNFSKMFDISFEDPTSLSDSSNIKKRIYAYQNSWGLTTRTIGVLIMVHGDNKGLVLPPKISKFQIVIVPCGITATLSADDKTKLYNVCDELGSKLKLSGIRCHVDLRDNYSPGWKFNHWELKGVPLRIEIGPRDIKQNKLVVVRRDTGEKSIIDNYKCETALSNLLDCIQNDMYKKASNELWENIVVLKDFKEFCAALEKKKLIMSPFCGEISCEDKIKKLSACDIVVEEGAPAMGAKGLCIPLKQPADILEVDKCICPECKNTPKFYTMFGRSY